MKPDEITNLIIALPSLLTYIVPGYTILKVLGIVTSKESESSNITLLKSIVVSYIYIYLLDIIGIDVLANKWLNLAMLFFSPLIGYLIGITLRSTWWNNFISSLGSPTIHSSFWTSIVDREHGIWLKVYLGNEKLYYEGELVRLEESQKKDNIHLVLRKFVLYAYSDDVVNDHSTERNVFVVINTRDITRVEVFYHPESKQLS